MKVNVSTILKFQDGTPLLSNVRSKSGKDVGNLTLAEVFGTAAAMAPPTLVETYNSDEQIRRYRLSLAIYKAHNEGSMLEISSQDAALLSGNISRIYAPVIVNQVLPLLEAGTF